MLMFDNVIFASFVPQILMFVGYLVCMLTGTQHALDIKRDVIVSQNTFEYSYQTTESTTSVAYFHDYVAQTAEISDEEISLSAPISSIVVFFHDYYFPVFKGSNYERFSRPPPSFC